MGSKVRYYLNGINYRLESAPPKHQHQNRLVESNWCSVIWMARSWLNSALISSEFWFYVVKGAVQVSNYLYVRLRGQLTPPFEIVYHTKPDIRSLFPLISITYIDKQQDNTTICKNLQC